MRRALARITGGAVCAVVFFACSVAGASASPDATAPVVTFTGNAGSYTVDQSITLSCAATDASGIASTTCPSALSAAPAVNYLGFGLHTQSAVAKDNAGNWGAGWTSFTVTAPPGSICLLTKQYLETSSHYTSATTKQRAAGDALANAACTVIAQIVPYLCPFTTELVVDAYKVAVTALVPAGWLTQAQANTLIALANAQLSPNGFTPTAPTAPTNVTATGAGNAQATVIWTPPLQDDGATVTSYKVTSSPGGKTATVTCPCPTLRATITGLTNGTSYTFTATATNSAGTSIASAISNAVTPIGPPAAPTGVTAAPGVGKAVVSFTAPASNGGSPITGYTVTSSPGGLTATGTASPITVTGLTGGTSYTFTVVATNAAGPGPVSAPSVGVTPTGLPGAPTGVRASVAVGSGMVSFTAPASNGGSAITKYTVTAAPGGATAIGTSSPITITGLAAATGYTFTVVATNTFGNGPGATSSSTPVVVVPALSTAEATGAAGAFVSFAVSSTDADDPAAPALCTTSAGPVSSPAGFPLGTTTVTCTATDPHGNSGTSAFTVTVRDTTPPVVSVPTLVTNTPVEATSHSGAVVTYTASASDLVSGALTPTCLPASGSIFPVGSTTVTCSATDTHGNTGTASFVVRVVDTTPPVVTVPADKTLEATGPSGATASFTASASDLVDGAVTATCAPLSGSAFPFGTTTVTCSATDAHGNSGSASFHVTVQDTTPPVVSVPVDKTVEATGASGAAVSFSASTSDLVDGAVATTCSPASGSTFALGTTTVACSATDAHGNTGSASFHVTVQDTTPPVVHVPTIVTNAPAEATGPGGAPVSYSVTASDLVGGALTPTCSPASGSIFPVGSTTVTCLAIDASGNVGTGSFTVKVVDTTPPTVTVPADKTVEATSFAGAPVSFLASAADLVDGAVTATCAPLSGSTFPLGTTTVTCSATDAHGNTGSASFYVTVQDTTPPIVTVPSDATVEATGPGGAPVSFTATTLDLVDGAIAPVCAPASGSTFPLGTTTVICSATDAHGNATSASFHVTVQDTTPPAVSVPADATVEATGPAGATATFSASASDLVDGPVTTSCAPVSGSTFALGMTTVTCSATDTHGNTASASFHVNVQDTTPPAVSVPADRTVEATGPTGATATFSASASDLVDGAVSATCAPVSGSIFPLGATTVTCSATDAHGNTGSASFTVKVVDTTAPVVLVPVTQTLEAGSPAGSVASFSSAANDLVDGFIIPTCAPASGSTFPLGTTTVTCSATDAHGNTGHRSFNVIVQDTTSPTVTVPVNKTVEATSFAGAPVTFAATSNDAVDGAAAASCSPVAGSIFPLGTTTVTCSATDAHGNTGSASFHVTVQDTTPPTVTVPSDRTVNATSATGASVTFTASATDIVDGSVAPTCAPVSGSTFALGATTVTCTATDAHGNTGTASFKVTVAATVPGAPTAVTGTGGSGSASVSFTPPASSGGSPITSYTVTASPAPPAQGISAPANAYPGTSSGVTLAAGQSAVVSATGAWSVGGPYGTFGPNGNTGVATEGCDRSLTAHEGGLIGSLDGGTTWFPLGAGPTTVTGPGTLLLSANDCPPGGNFGDNSGTLAVTVTPSASATGSGSPIAIDGLVAGQAYTFTATAANSFGSSPSSTASSPVSPTGITPGAPTGVSASAGQGQATVSFTAPAPNGGPAVTGYTVTASPGGITATGTSSPISVIGLTGGVSYTFTVVATSTAGSSVASAASAPVVPTAPVAPGAPTGVVAIAGSGQASVSFTAPASNGGAPITSYTVTSSPGGLTATGASSPLTVTGLSGGQSYSFTVTARTSAGTSGASAASPAVTPLASGLTMIGPGTGIAGTAIPASAISATLVGETPAAGGTLTFTVFGPQPSAPTSCTSGGTVVGTATVSGNGTYTPSAGFTPATTGAYWWYASYSGDSSNSPIASTCGNAFVPGSPFSTAPNLTDQSITYNPSGTLAVTVDFNSSTISVFSVKQATGALTQVPGSPFGVGSPSSDAWSVAFSPGGGLLAVGGQFGALWVYAVNAVTGALTAVAGSPFSTGGGVYSLAFSPGGKFLAAANDFTSTVSVFSIDQTTGSLAPVAGSPFATGNSPYTIAFSPNGGLLVTGNQRSNDISVFSVNQSTGALAQVPGSPFGVGTSTPDWVAFSPDGNVLAVPLYGNGVLVYAVNQSTGTLTPFAGSPFAAGSNPDGAAFSPAGVLAVSSEGSTNGIYLFSVNESAGTVSAFPGAPFSTGVNPTGIAFAPGSGLLSTSGNVPEVPGSRISVQSIMSATAVTAIPGVPTGVTAVAGNGQAAVSFTAPASSGGLPITSYNVTASPGGLTASGSSSPITVLGLTPGVSYTFTVVAANADGASAPSSASAAIVPTEGAPGAPTGVSAGAGHNQATVSFTAPLSNGGRAITSYTATSSPGGLTATGSASPLTVAGLTNGVSYTFTVVATNLDGPGAVSAASIGVTPTGVPNAPTGVTALVGQGFATVSFTAPANNGGLAVTSYTVTSSPGGITATGASPIVVTGLTAGIPYSFTVVATNAIGNGPASQPSTPVIPLALTVPLQPTNVVATGSVGQASVSFSAPAADGGSPILSYTVISSPGGLTATGSSSPIEITGLTSGVNYSFTVTAANAIGNSAPSTPSAPIVTQSSIIAIYSYYDGCVDVATGDVVEPDGSEFDPVTFNQVTPAPPVAPPIICLGDGTSLPYGTTVLTLDPNDGLYTTLNESTVDLTTGNEFDAYGDELDQVDLTQTYLLTTVGTLVAVTNPTVQLDPQTLLPVSTNPYTVESTPAQWQIDNGPQI